MMSNWTDTDPEPAVRFPAADPPRSARDRPRKTMACPPRATCGVSLLWFLVSTGSYKLRILTALFLLRGLFRRGLVFEGLFLGRALHEGLHKRGILRLFASRNRLCQVGRDHYQQFRGGLLGLTAFEQAPNDGHVADPRNFDQVFGDPIVQESGDDERLAVLQHDFSVGLAL